MKQPKKAEAIAAAAKKPSNKTFKKMDTIQETAVENISVKIS